MQMRSLVFTVLAALSLCAEAESAECQTGSDKILRLDQWAIAQDHKSAKIAYTNISPKGVSIAQGGVFFYDPLGAYIGFAAIDPDTDIPVGGSVSSEAPAVGLERTASMLDTEIEGVMCLVGVVYADGTKQTFSGAQ